MPAPAIAENPGRIGGVDRLDQEQVPIATRQNRLGRSDARTRMRDMHAMSEDGRRFAARRGQPVDSDPNGPWLFRELSDWND